MSISRFKLIDAMPRYKLNRILEILNEPASFLLEEEDRFTVREYLYPKNKEELNDEDKRELVRIGRKYKSEIEEEISWGEE